MYNIKMDLAYCRVVCNMKTSGTHDSDPWNFCSSQGGDLTYYFFMFVESRGGARIKEKIWADLPSDIFACSVKNAVEINVKDDTTMPVKQQHSKCETNNQRVIEMIASSNKEHACSSQEHIDVQWELAEEHLKMLREISDAQSRDT